MAQPGRVATLIEKPNAICHGMAFLITPEVFSYLDHRERNGYLRFRPPLNFGDELQVTAKALANTLAPETVAYLGRSPYLEVAGPVATLIEKANGICHGMAFLITPEVFSYLDHRAGNGYLRFSTPLYFSDEVQGTDKALVYVATPDNGAFLGPASELEIARHIAHCHGASGPNKDYLLNLHAALNKLGTPDPHVESIARHLLQSA